MSWESRIAWIALIFSIICFVLFVMDAVRKPKPEDVAERVANNVAERAPGLDPRILGELAKALGAAFSKIGPGLVALIGAIIFLLLSGEATGVYQLTGNVSAESEADGEEGDGDDADDSGNEADDAGNEANESVIGSDDSAGNEAAGNAT